MMKTLAVLLLLISFMFCENSFSQGRSNNEGLVQFSGVMLDHDSLIPIPFASIMIVNTHRGTVSDYYGFFSFVAREGDTIEFSSLGYKKAYFVIPDSLTDNKYSIIQRMLRDTIQLQEAIIYPWPSREQFREAFLKLQVPDDDLERAKRNLAMEELRERARHMPMDGSMNFRNTMHSEYTRLYSAGQLPMNNLLNPLAWASFIKAWKNGDFKIQNE
jgi:hypothetical protein